MIKLFTMYLVVVGHVASNMVNGVEVGSAIIDFIYSFHMPLFMLLCGYFVTPKTWSISFIALCKKKFIQLLLPVFTCTLICCMYLYVFRPNSSYQNEIIGNSWFLKTLFVYFVLFSLLKRLHINDWILCVGSIVVLFLIPHASSLQINLLWPFFWAGYFLRKYNVFDRLSNCKLGICRIAILFFILYVSTFTLQLYYHIPNYVEINHSNLLTLPDQILLRYLVAFSGSMFVIVTISALYKKCVHISLLTRCASWGKYTLGIYVLQEILIIKLFKDTIAWYEQSPWLLSLIAVLLGAVCLIICIFLIHLLSKSKYIDLFLFGRQYYRA